MRVICAEQGIPIVNNAYVDQRRSIDKLVATTSRDIVADAYFNGNIAGMESAVDSAKGAGTFARWKAYMQAGNYADADALL